MLPVLWKLEGDQDFFFFFLRTDFIKILACHRSAGNCVPTHIFIAMQSFAVFEGTCIRVSVLIKNADLNQILLVIPTSCIWFVSRCGVGLGTPSSCLIQLKWSIHSRRFSNTVKLLKGTVLGKINSKYPPKTGVLYRGDSQDHCSGWEFPSCCWNTNVTSCSCSMFTRDQEYATCRMAMTGLTISGICLIKFCS